MNTKNKGNIGEILAIAEFTKRNIQVSLPFGDNARYDMIADFNGKLNRIQVKYCGQISENNSFICPTSSSKNHTTNKKRDIYVNEIDYFVFYLVPIEQLIIVPIDVIENRKSMIFRIDPPKNGQINNVNFVQDYTFDKILGY